MRDITIGETLDIKFCTTEPDTGAPATLSGTPVVSAYVGNSTTQITAGITLTVDFDSVTGLNNVRVAATTGNGYTDGTDVSLVITTGTVDGNSAVGYVIENFTIGRGAAFTRLGAPAGDSVSADIAAIEAQTDDIASITAGTSPDVLVDTTIATLASQTSFTLTAGSSDDDAYNGMAVIFTDQSTATQKWVCFVSDYTGSTKTVTLESAPGFTVATGDGVAIMAAGGSTSVPVTATVADAGAGLTDIPWNTDWDTEVQSEVTDALNAYDPPTNAELTARTLASASYATATALATVDTVADGIKAKTDQLTFTKTNEIDANIQSINGVTITGDGETGTEFSVA